MGYNFPLENHLHSPSPMGCSERSVLATAVAETLDEIRTVTEQLLFAVRNANHQMINTTYRKLEAAEQRRDERMTRLLQHEKEHSCTGPAQQKD